MKTKIREKHNGCFPTIAQQTATLSTYWHKKIINQGQRIYFDGFNHCEQKVRNIHSNPSSDKAHFVMLDKSFNCLANLHYQKPGWQVRSYK